MKNASCDRMLEFINSCPSSFHTAEEIRIRLLSEGFEELSEGEIWKLSPGKGYFTLRGGSSVAAFRLPQGTPAGFGICASHSDSPRFKLKENAELELCGRYTSAAVEKYGGMLFSTWFDRPLSLAGRVTVRTERGIESRLINIDRDLLVIPSLAIHMNRRANEGVAVNPAKDCVPLFSGSAKAGGLEKMIEEAAGGVPLSCELFVYNRQRGTYAGANDEFIISPALDDLECVFCSLEAFLSAKVEKTVAVLLVADNEEVGSGTKQGAASTFLADTLERISVSSGYGVQEHKAALSNSFMVSADNAHAVHPNYPEFADRANSPALNGGVVIKYNAEQKYTTDAVSAAIFAEICERASVPVQRYANRADLPGGSTLGSIADTKVSVNTVDIGLAQLAMHSSTETAGADDVPYMCAALREFYSTAITYEGGGKYCF